MFTDLHDPLRQDDPIVFLYPFCNIGWEKVMTSGADKRLGPKPNALQEVFVRIDMPKTLILYVNVCGVMIHERIEPRLIFS
jgi:hypothetical protein